MFICEYCGRYLKRKYEKCPACGSTSFKKVQNIGEKIIKVPPRDGYKINTSNFKFERKKHEPITTEGVVTIIYSVLFSIPFILVIIDLMKNPSQNGDKSSIIIFGIFFGCVVVALLYDAITGSIKNLKKSKEIINNSKQNIDRIERLAKTGILIKNLRYKVIPTKNINDEDEIVYKIQVVYEIKEGTKKCFQSEPKYLTALGRDDGTVDLLVDPNDYSNYFIDFEIY